MSVDGVRIADGDRGSSGTFCTRLLSDVKCDVKACECSEVFEDLDDEDVGVLFDVFAGLIFADGVSGVWDRDI